MAIEQKLNSLTLTAGADLSAKQYTFVKLNTSGKVINTSVLGERAVGVVQDKPLIDKAATVANGGVSKVQCGGTIAAGAAVTANATGLAVAAITGNQIMGYALEAGVTGRIISVILDRMGAF